MARREDRIDQTLKRDLAAIKLLPNVRDRRKWAKWARDKWARARAAKARRVELAQARQQGIQRFRDEGLAGFHTAKQLDPQLKLAAVKRDREERELVRQLRKRADSRERYRKQKLARLNQARAALELDPIDAEDRPAVAMVRRSRQGTKPRVTIAWDRVGSTQQEKEGPTSE